MGKGHDRERQEDMITMRCQDCNCIFNLDGIYLNKPMPRCPQCEGGELFGYNEDGNMVCVLGVDKYKLEDSKDV